MHKTVINPSSVFDTLQYGFSQAVVIQGGRRVLLSGQVGVDANERTVDPGLSGQTHAALDNIAAILRELGGDLAQVVFLRIYLVASVADEQERIAEALRQRFPADPPATSWLVVNALSVPEWLIEIEAEAVLPELP